MRAVIKPSADTTELLDSQSTRKQLTVICLERSNTLCKASIYSEPYDKKDQRGSRVLDQLNLTYFGKCAYCERQTDLTIEHYRPKKSVSGLPKPLGYYWLCYEWTNLLPVCHRCNAYKGTKFPVKSERVTTPPWLDKKTLDWQAFKAGQPPLIDEQPMLVNPELDNPVEYFSFEIGKDNSDIKIKGIDQLNRGATSIEVYRLNREEITLSRKTMIDVLSRQIRLEYLRHGDPQATSYDRKGLITGLVKVIIGNKQHYFANKKETHTLLWQYIFSNDKNFNTIVGLYLHEKVAEEVAVAASLCL